MAEEELVRIRATLDNSELKVRGDETVRTLGQVRAAVGALPPQLRQASGSFSSMASSVTTFSVVGQTSANRFQRLGVEAERSGRLLDRLKGPLQNVALGFVGIQGPAGKVVERLGEFAVGGGITLAVTAGLALIVAGIQKIGAAAREEREKVTKLRDALLEASSARFAENNPYKALVADADRLVKRQQELNRELEAALKPRRIETAQQGTINLGPDLKRAKELRAEIQKIGQALTERSLQAQDQARENADRSKAEAERVKREQEQAAREAERLANARRREVQQVQDAELALAGLRAKANRDVFGEEQALRREAQVSIERTVDAADHLSATERARLETLLQQVAAYQAQLRDLTAIAPLVERIAKVSGQEATNLRTDIFNARRPTDQRVSQPGGIPDPFGPGGAEGLVGAAARKRMLQAIGGGILGNLGGQLAGALQSKGGVLGGTLGGALSGFMSGGPVGAIVGGVGGLIGGLFGGGRKKAEERAAREETLGRINSFVDTIKPQGSPLEQSLGDLKKRFEELYEAGKKVGLGNHELARLTREYQAAQERLRKEFEEQQGRFREGLEIRALEAQGLSEEAALKRQALAAAEELRAAEKEGYDFLTIERLKEVQALEAERDAKARLAAAAASLRQLEAARASALGDLVERERRLAGDTAGADAAGLENRAREQLRAAQDALAAGTLTEEMFSRLAAVIDGELKAALAGLTQAAADAAAEAQAAAEAEARAIAEAQATLREDLTIRELRLKGLEREALEAEAAARASEELRAARESGATEADLARLAAVLDGELKAALESLTQSAIDQAEALRRAETDFRGDLEVQLLRSTGRGDEADRLELEQRQAKAVADAIASGFGSDTLDLLAKVQTAQRDQLLAQQRERLEGLSASGGPAGRPSERLGNAEVRSITAGQADSMIAYLSSIAAYTRILAQAAVASGAGGAGDRALAVSTGRAAQAAGYRAPL